MSDPTRESGIVHESPVARRAGAIFAAQLDDLRRGTDRLFAILLPLQWLVGCLVSLVLTPSASTGYHRGLAFWLGGAIVSLPTALCLLRPGMRLTRELVAIAQMLIGALLIHLTGGRIETHFHVFGSLAFLAIYRDWSLLLTASAVVAIDHFLRGTYWPLSIFGVPVASPWRWVEHAGWVVFEDVVLVYSCARSVREMAVDARRKAEVQVVREHVEQVVAERTEDLRRANLDLAGQVRDRELAEEELIRSKLAAESANRSKSEFLANMSHEIRTPMNGILGMTELTMETELSPRQREYLGLVRSSAESLLSVINDILDFSKIEAGKLEIHPCPFALREALEETLRSLAMRAHAKGLELACRIAPGVPDLLEGDPLRLRQILLNLAGNAVKFTDAGEVVIVVNREPAAEGDDDDDVALRFSVADTGIGIPSEKLATIFAPFEQADGASTRKYGGTGLGLTISSRLVALMGGRVWVESEPGTGSTFHFLVRLRRWDAPEGTALPSLDRAILDRRPILIVDDNATNRLILEETLSAWGAFPVAVPDGMRALRELSDAARRGEPYTAALIDGMMPGMDGFELAGHIREMPNLAAVRMLMLTSAGPPEDPERCPALGISACLTKPIRQSELFDALVRVIGTTTADLQVCEPSPIVAPARPALASGDDAPAEGSLRILLAEDHPVNQKVASKLLEGLGHVVTVAGDGRQAYEAFLEAAFDVVLMDVQMPEMDGFEATAAIRRAEAEAGRGAHLPIFALTAHAMKGDRERCLASGFDEYIAKPIRRPELIAALATLRRAPEPDPAGLHPPDFLDPTADRPGATLTTPEGVGA